MNDTSSPQLSDLQERKLELELRKMEVELKGAEMKLAGKEKPSVWEIARTLITWLGITVPVLISVFTFLHQRDREIQQERIKGIQTAMDLTRDPSTRATGILSLSLYGKETIPLILGNLNLPRPGEENHIEGALAVLSAIQSIGSENLKPGDLVYLRARGNSADQSLKNLMAYPPGAPTQTDMGKNVADGWAQFLENLDKLIGPEAEWRNTIDRYRIWKAKVHEKSSKSSDESPPDNENVSSPNPGTPTHNTTEPVGYETISPPGSNEPQIRLVPSQHPDPPVTSPEPRPHTAPAEFRPPSKR